MPRNPSTRSAVKPAGPVTQPSSRARELVGDERADLLDDLGDLARGVDRHEDLHGLAVLRRRSAARRPPARPRCRRCRRPASAVGELRLAERAVAGDDHDGGDAVVAEEVRQALVDLRGVRALRQERRTVVGRDLVDLAEVRSADGSADSQTRTSRIGMPMRSHRVGGGRGSAEAAHIASLSSEIVPAGCELPRLDRDALGLPRPRRRIRLRRGGLPRWAGGEAAAVDRGHRRRRASGLVAASARPSRWSAARGRRPTSRGACSPGRSASSPSPCCTRASRSAR